MTHPHDTVQHLSDTARLVAIYRTWRPSFAPPESTCFFTEHDWTEVEFRAMWDAANRLNRAEVPLAWLWKLISRFRQRRREEGRSRAWR